MNLDKYWTTTLYQGRGVIVEVKIDHIVYRNRNWHVRFLPSTLAFYGFKNKFDALLFAAHKMKRSMKSQNWIPIK